MLTVIRNSAFGKNTLNLKKALMIFKEQILFIKKL